MPRIGENLTLEPSLEEEEVIENPVKDDFEIEWDDLQEDKAWRDQINQNTAGLKG